MRMNLKMKTLAAAIVASAAVSTANANSLLFPYFTTANGAQSILTLTTTGTAGATPTSFNGPVHYVYNYGPSCTHFDGWGYMSGNDLMQHSLASPAAGGFGKVVGSDKSTPFHIPLNTSGFLTVTYGADNNNSAILGEMLIADPTTGIFTAYAGISDGTASGEANFSNITDTNFRLAWYPDFAASTSWYVVVVGNMSSSIGSGSDWKGKAVITNNNFVYDNDEAPYSGTVNKTITCSGTVSNKDLMNAAQLASVKNGGIINIGVSSMSDGGTGLVLTKLQTATSGVGAPYAGKTFLSREIATNVVPAP